MALRSLVVSRRSNNVPLYQFSLSFASVKLLIVGFDIVNHGRELMSSSAGPRVNLCLRVLCQRGALPVNVSRR